MLQKKPLAGRKVEVTFRMPPLDDVVELCLCGEFNGWQVKGVPLVQETDGTWVATLVLDGQRQMPKRLLAAGFKFKYSDAVSALRDIYM